MDLLSLLAFAEKILITFAQRLACLAAPRYSRMLLIDRMLISSALIIGGFTGQQSWPGSRALGTRQPRLTSFLSKNAARISVSADGLMVIVFRDSCHRRDLEHGWVENGSQWVRLRNPLII